MRITTVRNFIFLFTIIFLLPLTFSVEISQFTYTHFVQEGVEKALKQTQNEIISELSTEKEIYDFSKISKEVDGIEVVDIYKNGEISLQIPWPIWVPIYLRNSAVTYYPHKDNVRSLHINESAFIWLCVINYQSKLITFNVWCNKDTIKKIHSS